jgi:hypothetical protein
MALSSSAAVPVPNQNSTYDTSSGPSTSTINSSTHTLDLLSVQVEDDADIGKRFIDNSYKDAVKQDLVKMLAEKLLSDNRIEFTQQLDPINDRRIFRAYTYVGTKQVISVLRNQNHLDEKDITNLHQWLVHSGYNIPIQTLSHIVGEVEKRLDNKR